MKEGLINLFALDFEKSIVHVSAISLFTLHSKVLLQALLNQCPCFRNCTIDFVSFFSWEQCAYFRNWKFDKAFFCLSNLLGLHLKNWFCAIQQGIPWSVQSKEEKWWTHMTLIKLVVSPKFSHYLSSLHFNSENWGFNGHKRNP
jgi:hypothetical protein